MPAALVEQPLGVELANDWSALPAELHPSGLVLRRDERERAAELTHPRGSTNPVSQPLR
jgi:hypothetical protein